MLRIFIAIRWKCPTMLKSSVRSNSCVYDWIEFVRIYDETWSQFHQHFTYEFFVQTLFQQLFLCTCNVHVTKKKLPKRRAYEKNAQKMLMKLTARVNFINIFQTNFLYKHCFGSFSLVTCKWKKLSKQCSYGKFVLKICAENVDEIDT